MVKCEHDYISGYQSSDAALKTSVCHCRGRARAELKCVFFSISLKRVMQRAGLRWGVRTWRRDAKEKVSRRAQRDGREKWVRAREVRIRLLEEIVRWEQRWGGAGLREQGHQNGYRV